MFAVQAATGVGAGVALLAEHSDGRLSAIVVPQDPDSGRSRDTARAPMARIVDGQAYVIGGIL